MTLNSNRDRDHPLGKEPFLPLGWKLTLSISGGLLILCALGSLLAWACEAHELLQLDSAYAILHYNTALLGLIWGVGLFAISVSQRQIVRGSAGLLILAAFVILSHHLGIEMGNLEEWLFSLDPVVGPIPLHGMIASHGLAFGLGGLGLWLVGTDGGSRNRIIAAMVLLACIVLLVLPLGADSRDSHSRNHTPSLLGTAFGLLGSVPLLFRLIPWNFLRNNTLQRVPLMVGMVGIAVSLVLWRALDLQQTSRLQRMVQFESVHLHHLLETELSARFRRHSEIASLVPRMLPDQAEAMLAEAVRRYPGTLGIAEVQADGSLHWINENTSDTLPTRLDSTGTAGELVAAVNAGRPRAVRASASCWNGSRVILLYGPFPGLPQRGLLTAIVLHEWIDTILNVNYSLGYAIRLTDHDDVLYQRHQQDVEFLSQWTHSLPVHWDSSTWNISIWPTESIMTRESMLLPMLVLVVGVLSSVLLFLGIHLTKTSRWRHRVAKEIHDRTQTELALKESEEKYRSLIENLEQGVFLQSLEGRFLAVNERFRRDVGRPEQELIGSTDRELFPQTLADLYREQVLTVIREQRQVEYESEVQLPDRKLIVRRILNPVKDTAGKVVGVLGICWDVTEQRAVEAKLRQASKMDAVGQLAGGIAHDFNNLLTAILGNLDLALPYLAKGEPSRELVNFAQTATLRAAALTKRLLGFSRRQALAIQPTDLNLLIEEVVSLLKRTIDPRIRLEIFPCSELWSVLADPDQLNQVVMNLCLNARDAIGESGKITLETACIEIDEPSPHSPPEAIAGAYVRLRITDTGSGMTPEVQARIFEPFFTTKEQGKGTGLGLAMVFGIVKQHRGWIECSSEIGVGTCFDIYLPKSTAMVAKPTPVSAAMVKPQPERHETILVVDDEPMIRRLAVMVLQQQGYHVLEAEDGQQGVDIYREQMDAIDLVLLDLTMPNLSGREAFQQMATLNPKVRVMFASGYSEEDLSEAEQNQIVGFVKKPYRPNILAEAVRKAITEGQSSTESDVEMCAASMC